MARHLGIGTRILTMLWTKLCRLDQRHQQEAASLVEID